MLTLPNSSTRFPSALRLHSHTAATWHGQTSATCTIQEHQTQALPILLRPLLRSLAASRQMCLCLFSPADRVKLRIRLPSMLVEALHLLVISLSMKSLHGPCTESMIVMPVGISKLDTTRSTNAHRHLNGPRILACVSSFCHKYRKPTMYA